MYKSGAQPIRTFLASIFCTHKTPPLSVKTKKIEERFYTKEDALEFCHQKINYYKSLVETTGKNLTELFDSPEGRKDQDKIKKLKQKYTIAEKHLKKWQSKTHHLRSKQYLKKPYQYNKMDELLGVAYLHRQGHFGKGIKVGLMEGSEISPTRSGHSYLKSALANSFKVPTSDHAQHTIGIIVAPAKTTHERLGVAPLSSLRFEEIPEDYIIQYQVDGKDYFFNPKLCQHVEPEFSFIEGLPSIRAYKPIENDPIDLWESKRTAIAAFYPDESDERVKSAIENYITEGIEIINVSSMLCYGPKSLQALKIFAANGGVIVKAAGNSGHKLQSQLAAYELSKQNQHFASFQFQACGDVGLLKMIKENPILRQSILFVGNLQNELELASNSCGAGEFQDRYLCAWGTNILSTMGMGSDYGLEKKSGTSMAAPMVAGVLAVLKEAFPKATARQLANILLETATPIGDSDNFGKGRLNAEAAFERAKELFGQPSKA